MSMDNNIKRIIERHHELERQMAAPPEDSESFTRISREYGELKPVVEAAMSLEQARIESADLDAMITDVDADIEIKTMAREERGQFDKLIPKLEMELRKLLLPKDAVDDRGVILEVRAGTGGEEAALFANELLTMYQRYTSIQGWKFELMEIHSTDLGGIREATAAISGKGVFARLKFESGVHRVQRVPKTETGGRIHTSAATVAVLPEAEDVDIRINDADLRIDVFRASGPGGQSVNTTDSAVRITHIPTGIVVSQQDEKSQHKNKAKALRIMRARVFEAERAKIDAERAKARKSQVGSGDRSERIRTYNFPQGRVSDHRINLTLYKIDRILTGEALDEVIDPLIAEDQAQRLAEDV
ncbi:MAG: peptide chain release factor 1 [Pseudomonadota bacterium]|nr:peptide chain release factor 1 [Pseudomonadota bacterium]